MKTGVQKFFNQLRFSIKTALFSQSTCIKFKKASAAVAVVFALLSGNGYAQPWTYNFGTNTGSYTNSNGSSTTFLSGLTALPTNGGTYRTKVSNGTGGGFAVVNPGSTLGTTGELQITAATNTSTNKFNIYGWTSPSTVAYLKCSMRTTCAATTGSGVFAIQLGDGSTTTGTDNLDYTGGDTYKCTYDFSESLASKIQKLKIPILICYGTKDWSAAYNDLFYIETIRKKITNITFTPYIGLEHNFFPVNEKFEPNQEIYNWEKVGKDWVIWLKKNN